MDAGQEASAVKVVKQYDLVKNSGNEAGHMGSVD